MAASIERRDGTGGGRIRAVVRILAVLAAGLLAAAVAGPAQAGAPRPTVTRAAAPAAARHCSLETARWAVTRFGIGEAAHDPNVTDPVAYFLCGPFTGPGSEAMLLQPNNGGTVARGYAHLLRRLPGGVWQHVWSSAYFGGRYAAAGTRVRETTVVARPGDPHCCPSGPTETRLWHWTGTAFVAGAFHRAPPTSAGFLTPAEVNVVCAMSDTRGVAPGVTCQSSDDTQIAKATLAPNGAVTICHQTFSQSRCAIGDPGEGTPTYGIGRTVVVGRFTCRVAAAGVTCTIGTTGKGFRIAKGQVARIP